LEIHKQHNITPDVAILLTLQSESIKTNKTKSHSSLMPQMAKLYLNKKAESGVPNPAPI